MPDRIPEQCIFCAILEKQQAAFIIDEEEGSMSILDIQPAAEGHTLIIPGVHAPLYPALPLPTIATAARLAQRASHALLTTLKDMGVTGTTIIIPIGAAAGQRAPHALIHVIPRRQDDQLCPLERRQAPEETVYATARAVRETLQRFQQRGSQ